MTDDIEPSNDGQCLDRVPETETDRVVPGRASREAIVDWWVDRFGVDPSLFDGYTFWEKGAGKIWIFNGESPDPTRVEALGLAFLRTRQEHWKPTTRAAQRFGRHAEQNVIDLDPEQARAFAAGEDQELPEWNGDWGYLIATHRIAGGREPIGVGLYLHDELRSLIPKGSREELDVVG